MKTNDNWYFAIKQNETDILWGTIQYPFVYFVNKNKNVLKKSGVFW